MPSERKTSIELFCSGQNHRFFRRTAQTTVERHGNHNSSNKNSPKLVRYPHGHGSVVQCSRQPRHCFSLTPMVEIIALVRHNGFCNSCVACSGRLRCSSVVHQLVSKTLSQSIIDIQYTMCYRLHLSY